jgi:ferredoxin--NADP+ reductase
MNTVMIDGTGMCGACRLVVGNETKFACVDGPHFDAHQIDWDIIMSRRKAYLEEEIISKER